MGCGVSIPKVAEPTVKPQSELGLQFDHLENYKDQGSSICSFTWTFCNHSPQLCIGDKSFKLDSFDLEMQHKEGKILSISIATDVLSPESLRSLQELFDTAWNGVDESIKKCEKVYKCSMQIPPQVIDDYMNNSSKLKVKWTSNAFDLPTKEELETLWAFTDQEDKQIVKNLKNYKMNLLQLRTDEVGFLEYTSNVAA